MFKQASGQASGNLPEPSGTAEAQTKKKQASGQASGNLPEPYGTAMILEKQRKLPDKLPETFRNLPDFGKSKDTNAFTGPLQNI